MSIASIFNQAVRCTLDKESEQENQPYFLLLHRYATIKARLEKDTTSNESEDSQQIPSETEPLSALDSLTLSTFNEADVLQTDSSAVTTLSSSLHLH